MQSNSNINEHEIKELTAILLNKEEIVQLGKFAEIDINDAHIDKASRFRYFLFKTLSLVDMDFEGTKITFERDQEKNFSTQLSFSHQIDTNRYLPFELESSGSQMLIRFIYNIFETYENKSILIVDELDSLIHPMIVPILNLITIKLDIQMLYSTHNISNMKYLYSDELYLIDKDENHNTKIQDLKEYDGYENFEKLYRNSILGGVPNIENINFDFIDELK